MKLKIFTLALITTISVSCQNNAQNKTAAATNPAAKSKTTSTSTTTQQNPFIMDTSKIINKTEEEWKKILTPEQYAILRLKGTERPWTGKFNMHFEKGKYICAGCGQELFSSGSKFESHCGWPSFDEEIGKGNIKTHTDTTYGMVRTEIMCGKCGGHLGHVFDDGPTKTGVRYCVNSESIDFKGEK
jgi:peptide-methionine (R)-S-oxide reductase